MYAACADDINVYYVLVSGACLQVGQFRHVSVSRAWRPCAPRSRVTRPQAASRAKGTALCVEFTRLAETS